MAELDDRTEDRRPEGGDEDEEEDIEGTGYKTVKDAVLFAIDVSNSMLQVPKHQDKKNKDNDSATLAALKCAYQLMQQRIISNPNDMMGVLLFGTEQSQVPEEHHTRNTITHPHCYLLTDLDVPAAADVRKLRDLTQDQDEREKLLVPMDESVDMANVLFCANQIFTTKAANFTSRRLFLVTDNESPHGDDKGLRRTAAVRAKDLYDLGVTIELFPIAQSGSSFDRSKFYDDIIYQGGQDPDAPAPLVKAAKSSTSGDGISLLQSLISSVNSKAIPRRALFTLPFEIGPGLTIGVKGYIVIKHQGVVRSCFVWVGGEQVQIATGSGGMILEDFVRPIEKQEVRTGHVFGGEPVLFSEEERKTFKHFGDPGLRILGFKSMDLLPDWANFRTPWFIYPEEADYVGSTRVFSALQQKLLASNKFAFAWFIARKNAHPLLVAVIAGKEQTDENGEQTMPPGLWLIPLPFADDIRQKPDIPQVKAPDALVDKMREIMGQLRLPKAEYDPSRYPNPSLQYFYKVLQSLALDEELPEQAEDKTIPRYKQIYKRAGKVILEWAEELENNFADYQSNKPVTSLPSGRVKREGEGSGPPSKRAKQDIEGLSDLEMRNHYNKGTLSKLTVAQLTEFTGRKRISTSSKKKADVISAIEDHLENHMAQ